MRYNTIAEIYSANEKAREQLKATVSKISDGEAAILPDGEKWTIQKIVEHLSMVDFGISRICATLLDNAKAAGKSSDGTVSVSEDFYAKAAGVGNVKIEAPERVQPTGEVTIAESLERMKTNQPAVELMRADLEKYDLTEPKFPHPYFGEINAAEWLIVKGGHEQRHTAQIERLIARIRK